MLSRPPCNRSARAWWDGSRRKRKMAFKSGRHFLQLPGPTNVPERIRRAMSRPTIDHRGPEFADLTLRLLDGLGEIFGADAGVLVYPSSATGGWEAALANTLSPGDRILVCVGGFFSKKWAGVARALGLQVDELVVDTRRAVDPTAVAARLANDHERFIKAVCVVHNETSTGVTSDVSALRPAIDETGHPALLMVDAVSSLGCTEFRHDDWGIDVTVSGSQKGLMLPPGLSFVAVSGKALEAHGSATLARSYWDWSVMREFNARGFFPYTPATNLLFGLDEAVAMLREEGLDQTFARHARHAAATRRAVEGWGLDTYCQDAAAHSNAATSVVVPEGSDAEHLCAVLRERFDMSVCTGLGELKGTVFRIGHLGDLNSLMLAGALSGVEMGLAVAGIPHSQGGVSAALQFLAAGEEGLSS